MEVSGQFHDPAALTPWKEPPIPTEYKRQYNIIAPSTSVFFKWSLSFRFSYHKSRIGTMEVKVHRCLSPQQMEAEVIPAHAVLIPGIMQ
jgi:hypothetical protein